MLLTSNYKLESKLKSAIYTKKFSLLLVALLVLTVVGVAPFASCQGEDTYNAYFVISEGGRLVINGTYYESGTANFTDQAENTVFSFTAEAATNYTFSDFDINGAIKPYNPYIVTLTGNVTVTASFVSNVVDSPTKASDFAIIVVVVMLALFILVPVLLLTRGKH